MQHDAIHKLLCCFPRVIADILQGYVRGDWVGRLDLGTLEQVPSERVSGALRRRLNDSVWRVRCDDGTWVWVYLMLEFQSSVDARMALRMLGYVAALYEELDRMEEFRDGKVPAVAAVVLYNGEAEWVRELDTRERIGLEPGSDLEEMLPRVKFPVIHERQAGRVAPGRGNVAGAMFRLWGLEGVEELADLVGQLRAWLPGEEDRALRDAFEVVIRKEVIPAYFEGAAVREVRGLGNIESMLRGNVEPFAAQYERRGLEKGLAQGVEQGREEIKSMQARIARTLFGDSVSERLEALLAPVTSISILSEVGDCVAGSATGGELLARATQLVAGRPDEGQPAD